MSTTKIGWLSDTHIDYFQYGLQQRWWDFTHAFDDAVGQMLDQKVDAILHTGDILHSSKPTPAAIKCLQRINHRLIQAGIPMWVVEGNHDATRPHWLEIVNEDAEHDKWGFKILRGAAAVGPIRLFGIAQTTPENFRIQLQSMPADTHILAIHQTVQEFIRFPAPGALKLEDLPLGQCQLIAIGDIHINDVRCLGSQEHPTWVGYTGSTEMNSHTEATEKVWQLLTFDAAGQLDLMDARPIRTRPARKFNIKNAEDLDAALAEALAFRKSVGEGEPMFFIKYRSHLTDVIARFRTTFNPDQVIMQFDPVYSNAQAPAAATAAADESVPELSLNDLLQLQLEGQGHLTEVATKLIDQNADPDAALEQFIESRLRSSELAAVA
jgi:DNA repair exonuclease SbcCD nuclease subunit